MKKYGLILLVLLVSVASVDASLVAWYKLDEAPGSSGFADSSGNNHNGGIWGTSDFTGTSHYFNRTGDAQNYLFTGTVPVPATSGFTWAVWVKSSGDPDGNGTLIQKNSAGWGSDADKALIMRPPSYGAGSSFDVYGQPPATGATNIQDGTWHHLALAFDAAGTGNVTIYVDGNVDGTKGMNLALTGNGSDAFNFGLGGAGGWFHGEMKDIRLYDETLSQTQIQAIVPEPATLSLLGLGLVLLKRKR